MLTHSRKPPQVPFQEITEFLQQFVSIPSVESEQAIATCVAEKLTALGFEPRIPPSFVIIKRQLRRKQSGYNPTSIPLPLAIALNGNTTRLLEQLLVIGFTGEGWLTRKRRSPYSSILLKR